MVRVGPSDWGGDGLDIERANAIERQRRSEVPVCVLSPLPGPYPRSPGGGDRMHLRGRGSPSPSPFAAGSPLRSPYRIPRHDAVTFGPGPDRAGQLDEPPAGMSRVVVGAQDLGRSGHRRRPR